jgi:hypothetical protein
MSRTPERPLGQVLATAWDDFVPQRPNRPPWHQPTLREVQVAYTGNIVIVPLEVADRVQLHNLGAPSDYRDDLEFFDWTPAGWGGSAAA